MFPITTGHNWLEHLALQKSGNAFHEIEILDDDRELHVGVEQPLLQEVAEHILVSLGADLCEVTLVCVEQQQPYFGKGGRKRPREDNGGAGRS